MTINIETIQWQGLVIEVLHHHNWSPAYKEAYDHALDHLEITSLNREPLPITETGYVSRFERAENIAAKGGAVLYVLSWLDQEVQSPQWREAQANARQLALF